MGKKRTAPALRELFYGNYVRTMDKRLVTEFEHAICTILRRALPDRYGICRGYVVDQSGNTAGDDIVIYDQYRFPTLRLFSAREAFAKKNYVPVEAVYAYIEAKHTLQLVGDGPASLKHACDQTAKVRELCMNRKSVSPMSIGPYMDLDNPLFAVNLPFGYPAIRNPLFSMIFARHVREKKASKRLTKSSDVYDLADGIQMRNDGADIFILGHHNVIAPITLHDDGAMELTSPFYLGNASKMSSLRVENLAYGIGLCSLLFALDWILLGTMNWGDILGNAMGTTMIDPDATS